MNNRRKLVIAFGAGTLALPFSSFAQQAGKVWRLGYLDFGSRQSTLDSGRRAALIEGLKERGYVEGRNFVLEERHADGDAARLNGFAAELVHQKVDLILSTGGPATFAAKRATTAIPIVVTVATDPVGEGYAASLARPGGNLTGMATGVEDTVLKLVELLILAVPKLKRIAVVVNSDSRPNLQLFPRIQAAAHQAGKQSLQISVRAPMEIERGFAAMAAERGDSVIILPDAFLFSQRALIAGLALKQRLPSINALAGYAEAGGLMSYGLDVNDNFRRAGIFVDKILKGEKPGDIPFEQPTRYYLVINRKTANSLGIKLTGELLARADKVIE